jgi:hypothetical protein
LQAKTLGGEIRPKTGYFPSAYTTQHVCKGANLIAEYEKGILTRKYIYGPGLDKPICMIGSASNEYHYYCDDFGSIKFKIRSTWNGKGTSYPPEADKMYDD